MWCELGREAYVCFFFLTLSWESEKKMNRLSGTSLVTQWCSFTNVSRRPGGESQGEVSRWSAGWPPIVLLFMKAWCLLFFFLARIVNLLEIVKFSFSYFIIKENPNPVSVTYYLSDCRRLNGALLPQKKICQRHNPWHREKRSLQMKLS